MTKAEAKQGRYDVIKTMYMAGALIYDIADAVGYQPATVENALREMGFSIDEAKPLKAVERKPNIVPVVVDGKEYWDVTDLFIQY